MDIERHGNLIEAGVWLVAAVVVLWQARCDRVEMKRTLWALAFALAIFGLSDVVEVHTGAWWRPWWLFAWKAACVVVLLCAFMNYFRIRKRVRRSNRQEENQ
jgi:hypothetical protein